MPCCSPISLPSSTHTHTKSHLLFDYFSLTLQHFSSYYYQCNGRNLSGNIKINVDDEMNIIRGWRHLEFIWHKKKEGINKLVELNAIKYCKCHTRHFTILYRKFIFLFLFLFADEEIVLYYIIFMALIMSVNLQFCHFILDCIEWKKAWFQWKFMIIGRLRCLLKIFINGLVQLDAGLTYLKTYCLTFMTFLWLKKYLCRISAPKLNLFARIFFTSKAE